MLFGTEYCENHLQVALLELLWDGELLQVLRPIHALPLLGVDSALMGRLCSLAWSLWSAPGHPDVIDLIAPLVQANAKAGDATQRT